MNLSFIGNFKFQKSNAPNENDIYYLAMLFESSEDVNDYTAIMLNIIPKLNDAIAPCTHANASINHSSLMDIPYVSKSSESIKISKLYRKSLIYVVHESFIVDGDIVFRPHMSDIFAIGKDSNALEFPINNVMFGSNICEISQTSGVNKMHAFYLLRNTIADKIYQALLKSRGSGRIQACMRISSDDWLNLCLLNKDQKFHIENGIRTSTIIRIMEKQRVICNKYSISFQINCVSDLFDFIGSNYWYAPLVDHVIFQKFKEHDCEYACLPVWNTKLLFKYDSKSGILSLHGPIIKLSHADVLSGESKYLAEIDTYNSNLLNKTFFDPYSNCQYHCVLIEKNSDFRKLKK
jgi:hypothetical protein